MDSTTGGDANDEFARWLAETARAEQAAAPAPAQPAAPAAPATPPASAATPGQPAGAPAPPPAPEFFGADELAAPPTRAYEPQLGGPPVARSSYQPPAETSAPAASPAAPPAAEYVTPTVLPASPPAAPPATERPSWAPGYTAPGSAAPGASDPVAPQPPAAPPTAPYEAPPAFPEAPAATPFFPSAPANPAPANPAPAYEPAAPAPSAPEPSAPEPSAPEPPQYSAPAAAPEFAATAPPAAFDPSAFQRPAADVPAFDAPPYVAPAPDAPAPDAPVADAPIAGPLAYDAPAYQAPAYVPSAPTDEPPAVSPASDEAPSAFPGLSEQQTPAPPPADPFGALFTAGASDDTASRLAASPPPSLVSPTTGELPADEDPLKSLFGLETEEHPAIAPEYASAAAPVELPTYTPEPPAATPVYTPEPAFASAPAPTLEPAPAAAPFAASGTSSYALTEPATAPPDDDPNAGTQFFGGGVGEWEEPPDLDRSTTAEKVGLGLAIVLPPIGLIASIVNAVQSSRERGWVHRMVKISLVLAVILSVVAGFAGAYLYKVVDDGRKHDAIQAASAQFCATVAADPSMISPPAFGFPAPAASIPETITAFQAYVDKWTALAKVSPSGIRTDVNRVADSASGILDSVTTSRLVDNDENIAVMSSVAESTNIVGWADEYCG